MYVSIYILRFFFYSKVLEIQNKIKVMRTDVSDGDIKMKTTFMNLVVLIYCRRVNFPPQTFLLLSLVV